MLNIFTVAIIEFMCMSFKPDLVSRESVLADSGELCQSLRNPTRNIILLTPPERVNE